MWGLCTERGHFAISARGTWLSLVVHHSKKAGKNQERCGRTLAGDQGSPKESWPFRPPRYHIEELLAILEQTRTRKFFYGQENDRQWKGCDSTCFQCSLASWETSLWLATLQGSPVLPWPNLNPHEMTLSLDAENRDDIAEWPCRDAQF